MPQGRSNHWWVGWMMCAAPALGVQSAVAAEPAAGSAGGLNAAGVEFFESRIRPVLVQHCYSCHSAEAKKSQGGLKLDTRAALVKGGDEGPALVPGKPGESPLLKAIRHDGLKMPPKVAKLPDSVAADFEAWIKAGAPDPRAGAPKVEAKPTIDLEKGRKFWAFQPPAKAELPAVADAAWPINEIDRFVLQRIEQAGLKPVKPAGKREWIRRATFDLTGLPPTPEEVDAFLKDDSPNAHAGAVDRLLASPHYGERWARYWLDVARYAEDQAHTFGVKPFSQAFRYRDWVVKALNDDMPYDRFVRLQIAGDLMPPTAGDKFERLGGLGFFGLGLNYYKNSDAAQAAADELDDRVDTFTRGFLGLTVSCARCHDHKFDPIPIKDYYSLAGIFNGSQLAELPLAPDEEVERWQAGQKRIKEQTDRLTTWATEQSRRKGREAMTRTAAYVTTAWRLHAAKRHKLPAPVREAAEKDGLDPLFVEKWVKYWDARAAAAKPDKLNLPTPAAAPAKSWTELQPPEELVKAADALQAKLIAAAEAFEKAPADPKESKDKKAPAKPKPDEMLTAVWLDAKAAPFAATETEIDRCKLTVDEKDRLTVMRSELDKIKKSAPPKYAETHVLRGGGNTMKVFIRGNPARPGEPAPKGFLQVLAASAPASATSPTDEKAKREFGRLELADAVASKDNPLTARVIVNRIWQHHFGRGLVGTPSNFGALGERPTHPELLDWLTVDFVSSGWSIKALHRKIMLSAAYRLSCEQDAKAATVDADNRLLWRMNRQRLDVEAWRDSMLAVSGKLDSALGGPTIDLDAGGNVRRTLYAKISRHQPARLLTLFDFPDANVTAAARSVTTVPQQQLFVLNGTFVVEQAKAFAERVRAGAPTDDDRISLGYRLAYGRPPTAAELELSRGFLTQVAADGAAAGKLSNWVQWAQALLGANEFAFVD